MYEFVVVSLLKKIKKKKEEIQTIFRTVYSHLILYESTVLIKYGKLGYV